MTVTFNDIGGHVKQMRNLAPKAERLTLMPVKLLAVCDNKLFREVTFLFFGYDDLGRDKNFVGAICTQQSEAEVRQIAKGSGWAVTLDFSKMPQIKKAANGTTISVFEGTASQ